MKNTVYLASSLALAAAVPAPLFAQESSIDPVVVTGSRRETRSFDAPAAINAISQETIKDAGPGVNLSEAINRAPGITALNRSNYAQDLQISIRGFGARSTFGVRGVRILVDGIPATMPDGQGQAATIPLSATERIEVLRGPLAQLYGNAAGGVVQAFTADPAKQPFSEAGVQFGSFNARKYDLTGSAMFSEGFGIRVDATQFSTDGFRANSATERTQYNAKLLWQLTPDTRADVMLNSFRQPLSLDPLGLTAAQLAVDRTQAGTNALAQGTRKTIYQDQLGFTLAHKFTSEQQLKFRLYSGNRDVAQYLSLPAASQTPVTSSGGVVDLTRTYGGFGVEWQQRYTLASMPLNLNVGYDSDWLSERRRGFINSAGVAGATKRDELNKVSNNDLYVQSVLRASDQFSFTAGMRHTAVRFQSLDSFIIPGNPDDSGARSFSKTNPVLGATWHASDSINAYFNLGRGFETPTFAELAYRKTGTGLNFLLDPANSKHLELGIKAKMGSNQRLDAAIFSASTNGEIVTDTSVGGRNTFKNAGASSRKGVELSYNAVFADAWRPRIAATILNARFDDAFVSGTGTSAITVPAGARIPGVSNRSIFAELAYQQPKAPWHVALEAFQSGSVMANDQNTAQAPSYTTFALRAASSVKWNDWTFRALARIDNLTSKTYTGSVIVNEANQRYFEPAPGRTWLLGLSAKKSF